MNSPLSVALHFISESYLTVTETNRRPAEVYVLRVREEAPKDAHAVGARFCDWRK